HTGLPGTGEQLPVRPVRLALAVPGDQRQSLRMVAMRERNTCISGATCRCGDAGHHFEPDPCRRKRLQLLAAAAENEGIAALQPAYALALLGEPDQQRIDLLLRDVRCARRLAYID